MNKVIPKRNLLASPFWIKSISNSRLIFSSPVYSKSYFGSFFFSTSKNESIETKQDNNSLPSEKKKKKTPKYKFTPSGNAPASWAYSSRIFYEDPNERLGFGPSLKFPHNFEPKVGTWVSDEIKTKRKDIEFSPTDEHVIYDMPYEDFFSQKIEEQKRDDPIGIPNLPKERERHFNGTTALGYGGRKTSHAIARLTLSENQVDPKITVNGKRLVDYFQELDNRSVILEAFFVTETLGKFNAECTVRGGGVTGQSEAIRNAIADALRHWEPSYQHTLKIGEFLNRDPRQVERKKTGLKKARKTFQWTKR